MAQRTAAQGVGERDGAEIDAGHRIPTTSIKDADQFLKVFASGCSNVRAPSAAWARPRSTSAGSLPAAWTGSGRPASAVDTRAAALSWRKPAADRMDGKTWGAGEGHILATNGLIHDELLRIIS